MFDVWVGRTRELDELKFGDRDLDVIGTLEYGQFGVVRALPSARRTLINPDILLCRSTWYLAITITVSTSENPSPNPSLKKPAMYVPVNPTKNLVSPNPYPSNAPH